MNPNKNLRSGDEHYTPEYIVQEYLLPLVHDRFVWTPFGKDSTVKRVLSKYTTVIDTPIKHDGDFFKAIQDAEWIEFLKSRNACICDNPPFNKAVKIIRACNGLDFFLLYPTLTANGVVKGTGNLFKIIGRVKYQSGKIVNTCIASNKFNEIKHLNPISNNYKKVTDIKNILSSGNVDTATKNGLVIPRKAIDSTSLSGFGKSIKIKL